jgi:Mn-dependent DtxR family transcriptional regulator
MMSDWTFFSNYGHVLACLAKNRGSRLRDVALEVGITERAVQKIVRDLQAEGFLTISKQGRCNRYQINRRKALRHGLESHCTVGKLLALVAKPARAETAKMAELEPDASVAEEIPVELPLVIGEPSHSLTARSASTEKEKEKERTKEKKRASVDTREQGNLF